MCQKVDHDFNYVRPYIGIKAVPTCMYATCTLMRIRRQNKIFILFEGGTNNSHNARAPGNRVTG